MNSQNNKCWSAETAVLTAHEVSLHDDLEVWCAVNATSFTGAIFSEAVN